jgi:putative transposase
VEQTGKRYHFVVVGYVVMPEHVHLLFREPERGKPSLVLAALKTNLRPTSPAKSSRQDQFERQALWSTPFASWPPDVMRGTRPA